MSAASRAAERAMASRALVGERALASGGGAAPEPGAMSAASGSAAPTRGSSRWRLLDPPGAIVFGVPIRPAQRRAELERARKLPVGTPIVVEVNGPAAATRAERFARSAGLEIERRFVAFPSLGHARYRVEDTVAARRYFAETLLTAPPGLGRLGRVVDAGVRLLAVLAQGSALGMATPGRVVTGRRR